MKDDDIKKYIALDIAKKQTIASRLHSHFGQSLVAAKSFADAIIRLDGQDQKLLEAKEMATVILQMTSDVYSVTYDLMLENDVDNFGEPFEIESAIRYFSEKLRLKKRGVAFELQIKDFASGDSVSDGQIYSQRVLFDCIKTLMVYIARYAKANFLQLEIKNVDSELFADFVFDTELAADKLNEEIALIGIKNQLKVLDGDFHINAKNKTSNKNIHISMHLPLNAFNETNLDAH